MARVLEGVACYYIM